MSASADPFDHPDFASTLLSEAAADAPTPDEVPAAAVETAEETPTTPARERDATGRFVARAEPATDAGGHTPGAAPAVPPAAAEQPASETPPVDYAAQLAQLREENAQAARREETLRGQITNAQRQAETTAYQRGLAEAGQRQRQNTLAELDRLAATGQYDPAAIHEARQGWQQQWAAEDRERAQGEFLQQQANMELGGVALHMDHATVNLQQRGIPSLAQQSGLPEEYARRFFDADEVQRYQRAVGQAKMAAVLGERGNGLGFNPVADRDYLETVYSGLWLAGQIHRELTQAHTAREAELQAEIDRLTVELNRDEAPAARPEAVARGAGRRSQNPDDHATATLRAHANELAALLRVG